MYRLYLAHPEPPRGDKRSAKVIELSVRRKARKAARSQKPAPDRPRAA